MSFSPPFPRAQKQILLEFDHTLAVATAARATGCKACHLGYFLNFYI
jgi:hypothetical protein